MVAALAGVVMIGRCLVSLLDVRGEISSPWMFVASGLAACVFVLVLYRAVEAWSLVGRARVGGLDLDPEGALGRELRRITSAGAIRLHHDARCSVDGETLALGLGLLHAVGPNGLALLVRFVRAREAATRSLRSTLDISRRLAAAEMRLGSAAEVHYPVCPLALAAWPAAVALRRLVKRVSDDATARSVARFDAEGPGLELALGRAREAAHELGHRITHFQLGGREARRPIESTSSLYRTPFDLEVVRCRWCPCCGPELLGELAVPAGTPRPVRPTYRTSPRPEETVADLLAADLLTYERAFTERVVFHRPLQHPGV